MGWGEGRASAKRWLYARKSLAPSHAEAARLTARQGRKGTQRQDSGEVPGAAELGV